MITVSLLRWFLLDIPDMSNLWLRRKLVELFHMRASRTSRRLLRSCTAGLLSSRKRRYLG